MGVAAFDRHGQKEYMDKACSTCLSDLSKLGDLVIGACQFRALQPD